MYFQLLNIINCIFLGMLISVNLNMTVLNVGRFQGQVFTIIYLLHSRPDRTKIIF